MAHVLLIDEDPNAREQVRSILAEDGHTVVGTRNGKISLAAFQLMRPDLVVTGPGMAGPSGIATIKSMRSIDPAVPLIALCAGERQRQSYSRQVRPFQATAATFVSGSRNPLCSLISEALVAR
jgi:DNA-binding response OmpR family regulator